MINISSLNYPLHSGNVLEVEQLTINTSESILITGTNASGKSTLAKILADEIKHYSGSITKPNKISLLSFDIEADILAEDRKNDNSEYNELGIDMGRSALQIITEDSSNPDTLNKLITLFNLNNLLTKPFKILSTGETRKVLIAKALMTAPELLILDNPYTGLDFQSQNLLNELLAKLINDGIQILLFDFYRNSLPQGFSKIGYLINGKLALFDKREKVLNSELWLSKANSHFKLPEHLTETVDYQHINPNKPLIVANNVSLSFNQKNIFTQLNWQVESHQHWQIIGPNGCGKSTLLSMICGDSTKAYGQDITLFDRKRGTGESIWQIKKHYGIVSNNLHRDSLRTGSVLQTIISGFFDSIGLYDQPNHQHISLANQWLATLGLLNKKHHAFSQLSYGEQRLVLIARAMVKMPLILLLDEPCQGLDENNRTKVLTFIDYIATHSRSQILFVSHNPNEKLQCITHQLIFTPAEHSTGYRGKTIIC